MKNIIYRNLHNSSIAELYSSSSSSAQRFHPAAHPASDSSERHIQLAAHPPFPVPLGALVIKVEDERETDQELRDMFTKDVQGWLELKKTRGLQPSGSAQSQPPPAPPVQQAPPLPPPPPGPPPAAQHPCAKRPAVGPPPGIADVRTPPLKQYQRRPPGPNAPAQPQQPAPPNAHRAPAPPTPNAQRAGHAPQPVPGAHGGATAAPPVHAGPSAVPGLQRRTTPKPPHPAAKKKPTVPCTFCGVLCMTSWHLKQHEQGRKHRNRVAYLAGEMNVRCSVCNVHLSSGSTSSSTTPESSTSSVSTGKTETHGCPLL